MKRIIKETLSSGKIRYIVETNRIFGFIPFLWTIDLIYDSILHCYFGAAFDTLENAEEYCGVNNKIIDREIIWKGKSH